MPDFVFEPFHDEFFEALEKVENGEIKKLMVFMPPRASKSESISKRFPAWCLGRDSSKKIVCASYNHDLASMFGRKTKGITASVRFKNVFPDFKLSLDKKEGGNWETAEDGGYYSVGVGGGLTGHGYDIGIVDDPIKDRAAAESLKIREGIWDWWTSTFCTRDDKVDSAKIIMHTRWHTDDLAGRIIDAKEAGWTIVSYPAINDAGESLCPNRFPLSYYEQKRAEIGVRDFEALYQQDPIKASGQTFKKEDFRYKILSELDPNDFTAAIHVDPAFSSRDDSDDTAIIVTAKDKKTNEIVVLDCFGGTIAPSQSHDLIFSMAEKWKQWTIEFISIEEVSINEHQQLFLKGFEEKMRTEGKFHTLLPFNPQGKGKKEDRIKFSLEPMFNRHALYFRNDEQNKDWMKLEEQLLKFPVARHDDLSDCLSQGVIMWQDRKEEYEDYDGPQTDLPEYMSDPMNVY